MKAAKVGIVISLYDENDQELTRRGAWVDPNESEASRRALYDDVCAAIWPTLEEALEDIRAYQAGAQL